MGLSKLAVAVVGSLAMLAVGCGVQQTKQQYAQPGVVSGAVHGGQQPVSGATIQLYTVGTGGDGSASMALLTKTVTTDVNGGFNITGLYSCASATEVYITATGGDPSPGTANANLAMMTALGPCASLNSGTFIVINELTTVAATSALANYMNSPIAVGSGTGDAAALAAAFTLSEELVDSATGASPGLGVPSGYSVPTAEINTLGDVASACVNSGGLAGSGTGCSSFFALTKPQGGTTPTDTITALLNVAKNPTLNTTGLYGTMPLQPPFVPTVGTAAPPDFHVRLTPPASSMALQVAPASLTFPVAQVGYAGTALNTYVQNISGSAVAIGAISIIGANAGSFGETNNCGTSLAGGAYCSVTITVTPLATGALSAYLSVVSGIANSPQYVALIGSGEAPTGVPQLVLASFGLSGINGLSTDLTLSNIGSGPLAINGISTTTPYYPVTSHCGTSLASLASCTVTVTDFDPFAGQNNFGVGSLGFGVGSLGSLADSFYDQISVMTNDPGGTQIVGLVGGSTPSFITPGNVLFPGTVVGSSAATTVVLGPFTNNALGIYGPNAGDFSGSTSCPTMLSGSYPCVLPITFKPTAAGVRTAMLKYTNLQATTTYGYVPLVGIGLATAPSSSLTLTPTSLSFSDFSTPQQVTLTNYSLGTVNIQSIAASAGFSETNNCGMLIYGQSICTITVGSTQAVGGGVQGGLTVVDDLGTHTIPLASTLAQRLPFGSAHVGSTSPSVYGFDTYPGFPGTILDAYFTGGNPADFSATSCGSPSAISCSIGVYFTPTGTGARSAVMTVGGTDYDQYFPKYLVEGTGFGAGPGISFVGSNGPGPANLYNVGTTVLNLTGAGAFSVGGANASDFSVPSTTCGVVAVGANCTFTVGFQGSQIGLRAATVMVTDGTSGTAFPYAVSGLGSAPSIPGSSLNFPATAVNTTSAPMSATIASAGDPITAVLGSGWANFTLTKSSCAQGETPCLITATFNPVQGGTSLTGSATVTDGTTKAVGGISLSGVPVGTGYASVSPASLSFATRPSGNTSIPLAITVTNTGTAALGVSGASLSGTNAGEFLISSSSCSGSLAINGTCTVNVEFSPLTPGGKLASVVISGDAGTDLPISVMVTGTAQ